MREKEVKWALASLEGFSSPKAQHEQYATPPELAVSALSLIEERFGDIKRKRVLDLGCGTGMLSAACLLFGAKEVTGVDIDSAVEEIYARNMEYVSGLVENRREIASASGTEDREISTAPEQLFDEKTGAPENANSRSAPALRKSKKKYAFYKRDIAKEGVGGLPQFDIALTNPPFGTKNNEGIDVLFLEAALSKSKVVYSMHKTSTRKYLQKKYGERIEVISEMKFEIPKMYRFHKKESVHVDVDLIKVLRAEP